MSTPDVVIDSIEIDRLPDEPVPEQEAAAETPAEDDEDPDAEEAEGEENSDEPERPKRKRPGKYARTIMRLEEQNKALEGAVRQLLGRVDGDRTEPARQAPRTAEAPKQEEFQNFDDYLVARAKFEAKQEILAEQRAQAERQERAQRQQHAEQVRQSFQERAAAARERYQDFDEVAFDASVPVSEEMTVVIAESEHGPDIAYYLGSHPDEARRIASLSPLAQARELGRIEAKVSQAPVKKTTSAPPPAKILKGKGSPERDPSKMSIEEYRAWRGMK